MPRPEISPKYIDDLRYKQLAGYYIKLTLMVSVLLTFLEHVINILCLIERFDNSPQYKSSTIITPKAYNRVFC